MFGLIGLLILAACQQPQPTRFTTNSANIDAFKAGLDNYEKGNWDAWVAQFADTAQIFHNNWNDGMSAKQSMENHQNTQNMMSSYGFDPEQIFVEEVLNDNDESWVQFWGVWSGTFKATGKTIEVPVHLAQRYVDGKIVYEFGFWDSAAFVKEVEAIQAAAAAAEEEAEAES